MKGKFAYMSPEQLSSVRVDRRADVFAASIVLWEMITGQRLFQAADPAAIVGRVLHGEIKAPSTCAPGLPPSVDALVLCGLERRSRRAILDARSTWRARSRACGTPIARPTEVGTWVNRIAGDALKQRAKRLAEIESTGSFSRDGAANALAVLSQLSIDNTGSHSASRSRSGLRPVANAPTSAASVSTSASQGLPAMADADASQAIEAAESKKSHVVRNLFLLVVLLGAGAGAFVWQSGGVVNARARVSAWMHVEPHGVGYGASAKETAAAASTASVAVTTTATAIDITNAPATATTATVARAFTRHRRAARANTEQQQQQPADPPDPVETVTPQVAAPTGNVSARPGQGQVQAVIQPLMKSARGVLQPRRSTHARDDHVSIRRQREGHQRHWVRRRQAARVSA